MALKQKDGSWKAELPEDFSEVTGLVSHWYFSAKYKAVKFESEATEVYTGLKSLSEERSKLVA